MSRAPQDRPMRLFDTDRIATRRDRAMTLGFRGQGDFLHRRVADGLAERLAEVTRSFGDAVLIGSGAGVHAAAIAPVLPGVRLRQIDLSPSRAAAAGGEAVPTLDPLPVPPESADLILSVLELHALNDPVGQLIQMRRALRPDGLMIAALFGGQTLAELRAALAEAEAETTGGLSPRVAPMADLRDLGALLQRAGFAMPVADSDRLEVHYDNACALMRDLRAMGETNILTERRREPMRRATLTRCAEIYAASFPAPDGRVRATFEIVFLTGWAPAPDQPQPLRPGSAKARLADALGTKEQPAGEKTPPKLR